MLKMYFNFLWMKWGCGASPRQNEKIEYDNINKKLIIIQYI